MSDCPRYTNIERRGGGKSGEKEGHTSNADIVNEEREDNERIASVIAPPNLSSPGKLTHKERRRVCQV